MTDLTSILKYKSRAQAVYVSGKSGKFASWASEQSPLLDPGLPLGGWIAANKFNEKILYLLGSLFIKY